VGGAALGGAESGAGGILGNGGAFLLVRDDSCDIPLRNFRVKEGDLDSLVAETNRQTRVMGHSTYKLSSEEIKAIFARAP
jgi:hypothetical protein